MFEFGTFLKTNCKIWRWTVMTTFSTSILYEMIDNMGTFFFSCTYLGRCLFILYIVFKSAVVVNIKLAIEEEDAITLLVIIHK